jgi:hypothetical protein
MRAGDVWRYNEQKTDRWDDEQSVCAEGKSKLMHTPAAEIT